MCEAVAQARARFSDDPLLEMLFLEIERLRPAPADSRVASQPPGDLVHTAQIALFADRVERYLESLIPLLDQVVVKVRGLRREAATLIHAIRVAQVAATPAPVRLTRHELLVLRLVAAGNRNSEIAANLRIGPETVKSHLRSAFRKLGVHSRAEAVHYLAQHPPAGDFLPTEAHLPR